MALNRRILLLVIALLVLVSASIVSLTMFYDEDNQSTYESRVISSYLVSVYGKDYENKTLKEIASKDDPNFLMLPSKYLSMSFPFDFVITEEGILIKGASNSQFKTSGLKVGEVITKIDDKSVSELSYFKIVDMLYGTEKIKLETSKQTIEFVREDVTELAQFDKKEDSITVNLYNLDRLNPASLYNMTKDYENIVLNLENAWINDADSFKKILSIFKSGNLYLLDGTLVEGTSLVKYDKQNIQINVGDNNQDGIMLLIDLLNSYNLSNISFDRVGQIKSKTFRKVVSDDYYTIFYSSTTIKELNYESSQGSQV